MIHWNPAGRKILERLYVEKQRATETKALVLKSAAIWEVTAEE
jgi:hypothetical protein